MTEHNAWKKIILDIVFAFLGILLLVVLGALGYLLYNEYTKNTLSENI